MTVDNRLAAVLSDRYRFERELGRGGMATVYLAEYVRHHRRVAIKALHPELSAVIGPERFLKEIELTAGLQHPHILPLFDSGNADGLLYYVMPHVEGESLRARLERERQLPIDDAIRIAAAVASALDYAHSRGVVHRDIKPENILLHSGNAMVADFGIALAVQSAGGERLTQTGLSLGTPQYMAPEQAMGDNVVDHRADIYALGVVTYEMLAGRAPFTGTSPQNIFAKLLTEEPPRLAAERRRIPPSIEDAVHRALEKLPADRWNSAQAFASALSTDTRPQTSARGTARRDRAERYLTWTVAALAIVAAVWGWTRGGGDRAEAPPSRLAIAIHGQAAAASRYLAMSADGSRIAYTAATATGSIVEVRDLSAAEGVPVKGTNNASSVALTPDGQTLLFGDPGASRTFRVKVNGGTPELVPGSELATVIAFGEDGTAWYSTFGAPPLQVDSNGVARSRFGGDTLTRSLAVMQILPGGREALAKDFEFAEGMMYSLNLKTGKKTQLLDYPISEARFAAGYLLIVYNDGRLMAVPFDIGARRATGNPVVIANDVSLTGNGVAQFAVANNGNVAYVPTQPRELVLVSRSGAVRVLSSEQHNYHQPRSSPDGKSVLIDFTTADGRDVWTFDRAAQTFTRVTSDHTGHDASWSPDGRSILYGALKGGQFTILGTRPGSGATDVSITDKRLSAWPGRWMPDGKRIITVARDMQPNSGLDIVLTDTSGLIEPVVMTPSNELWPDVSPDGQWLAYASNRTGQNEVYVRPLKGGDQIQVSLTGGSEPTWSHDGRELFFRATTGARQALQSVTLRTTPTLSVTTRTTLFSLDEYDPATPHANYGVTRDGSFLMVRREPVSKIVLIQGLPALVRRLQGSPKPD